MDRYGSHFRGRRVIDEEGPSEPMRNGRQGHGRMDHSFDDEPVSNGGGRRGDYFGQESDDWDPYASARSSHGRPPGRRSARGRELYDLMNEMDLNTGPSHAGGESMSRQDESELARLEETHAMIEADLRALGDRYDGNEDIFDRGILRLEMIEEDMARIKYKDRQGGQGGKLPRGRGAPTDSTHSNPRQSHAEAKGHADRGNYSVSDLSKLKTDRAAMNHEFRYLAGIGDRKGCKMVEKSIANINRHISRLEADSGKGVEVPRGMGPSGMGASMRPENPEDFPDEYLDYQPCGSRRGHHERSAGYGRYPGHHSGR